MTLKHYLCIQLIGLYDEVQYLRIPVLRPAPVVVHRGERFFLLRGSATEPVYPEPEDRPLVYEEIEVYPLADGVTAFPEGLDDDGRVQGDEDDDASLRQGLRGFVLDELFRVRSFGPPASETGLTAGTLIRLLRCPGGVLMPLLDRMAQEGQIEAHENAQGVEFYRLPQQRPIREATP